MLGETLAVSATVAVAVLAGYAVYQLAIMASYIYFARFVVLKIYELILRRMEQKDSSELTIDGQVALTEINESTKLRLLTAINSAVRKHSHGIMHTTEAKRLIDYINNYDPAN